MTYVAKASHLAKRLSKPVTMTGTKPALRGYSVSIKEWAERKYRHVSPSLSLSLSLTHTFSPLFFRGSLHPAFHKLCMPIYTQLHLHDFDAMCLSCIEKGRESSSLGRPELLWKCTFHALLRGIDRWRHGRTCLK